MTRLAGKQAEKCVVSFDRSPVSHCLHLTRFDPLQGAEREPKRSSNSNLQAACGEPIPTSNPYRSPRVSPSARIRNVLSSHADLMVLRVEEVYRRKSRPLVRLIVAEPYTVSHLIEECRDAD